MTILSIGSLWRSNFNGYVYEIVGLTPKILYSPVKTYTTQIADSSIYICDVEEFLSRFTEGLGAIGAIRNSTNDYVLNSSGGYVLRSFT